MFCNFFILYVKEEKTEKINLKYLKLSAILSLKIKYIFRVGCKSQPVVTAHELHSRFGVIPKPTVQSG
jgi:hypothetical protein